MQFLRRSLVGIFLLGMTLALIAWAGNTVRIAVADRMGQEPRQFAPRERAFAINVATLTPQTIAPELTVFGELRSQRTLELRSASGGIVLETDAALVEGGTVQTGQLLLTIDPVDAQAALDRVAADSQDADATRRDAERGLALAEDELAAAQAQAGLRAQALARARDLLSRGAGTAASVETAELAASAADAAVLSRRQSLATAQTRKDQAETQLSRAQINLSEAQRALTDTQVFAAFDGTLSDVSVTPGGRISANESFAQLLDPAQLEVTFRISTSQYARLLDGSGSLLKAPITVTLDVSGVDLTATGRITRESGAVAQGQTGRLLFAKLDAAPGFRPGDFVSVRIQEPALNGVVKVPATALGADSTVLVVGPENRLAVQAVELLRRQGDDVIIRTAAANGQMIAAERSPLLGAGILVKPIIQGGQDAAPAAPATIALDAERRAKLIAFVQGSRMPDEAKARVLSQLEQDEVPAATIERLESRMGT